MAAMLQNDSFKREIKGQKLGNGALIVAVPRSDPESAETDGLIHELRRLESGGLHSFVTGATANRVDIMDRIDRGLPAMTGFELVITYLVLFVAPYRFS